MKVTLKKDFLKRVRSARHNKLEMVIKEIESEIGAEDDDTEVSVHLDYFVNTEIMCEVKRLYEEAGWTVAIDNTSYGNDVSARVYLACHGEKTMQMTELGGHPYSTYNKDGATAKVARWLIEHRHEDGWNIAQGAEIILPQDPCARGADHVALERWLRPFMDRWPVFRTNEIDRLRVLQIDDGIYFLKEINEPKPAPPILPCDRGVC